MGDADAANKDTLEFRILGPLEIRSHHKIVPIGGQRRRVVLLMLLLEPGRIITVDRLIEAIWDGDPPKTAETQVQICVSQLRAMLAEVSDADLIHTHSAGYHLQVPEDAIDMLRFRRLVAGARARRDDPAGAATDLRAALDLWRGEVAGDVTSRVVQAIAVRLNEERLTALQEWIELELALGRHQEHIGELQELVAEYPLRERLYAQLAVALYRAGRQAEALTACRRARQVLLEEHGIDPGEELRRLERAILANDPVLEPPATEPTAPAPRQLPAPPPDFLGRTETAAQMQDYLAPSGGTDRPDPPARSVRIVSISGAPGVGKSALAVQVAHNVHAAFPDGQLYAHLRGTDAVPLRPEQVLNQFLRALGVPPGVLSEDPSELAAQYRSRLAGRRILIVLDDAANEAQVRPLVPGDPGCALVVTSRQGLPGLAGARRIGLDVFDPPTSLALLKQVIGARRAEAEPEATATLADMCGHLPLALQIAAAKLSVKGHWQITQMVNRLGDERSRLDELTLDEFGVRPSIAISYRALPPLAARLLALLSALGATDFAGWVAYPLLDVSVADAAELLDQLVEERLVEVRGGLGHRTRYRLHDLTRIFARERLATEVTAPDRASAHHRLLRCWLHLATAAHRREYGGDHTVLHSDAAHWTLPPELVDDLLADPMQWFQTEYENLVAAVNLAAQLGHDDLCWDLAVTSVTLFENRAYHDAWRETHDVAMDSVHRAGNQRGEAVLRYSRGGLALAQLRLADARQDFTQALTWFSQEGDVHGRGLALRDLASIDRLQGRHDQAQTRCEAALADLRLAGDRVAEAHVLRSLAQVRLEQQAVGEAEALLREALQICAEIGVRRIEAQVQYRLGQVLRDKGELGPAEAAFRAVLAATEGSSDAVGRGNALLGLGTICLARDDHDQAGTVLGDALQVAHSGGSRLLEGQVLLCLAELQFRRGDTAAAQRMLDDADAIFHEIDTPTWQERADRLRKRLAASGR